MDQFLFSWINSQGTSPALDRLMAVLSCLDFWVPLLALVLAVTALRGGFKARAMLVVLLVTVGLTDGVVLNGLKHWANRPRPHQVEEARVVDLAKAKPRLLAVAKPVVVRFSQPETGTIVGRSFPSAHTANNFAAAAVLALFYRRWGWLYFLMSAAIGYSRVYVGAHWPSDVAVSVFLGTGLGVLFVALAEGGWRRWGARFAPGWRRGYPSLLGNGKSLREKVAV
ncbi:MAG: phosphatase PAP2 family protein [Chthoniobacteraceae bacterium]|nr:phosphatase PAP2 family protein [Chthoniobacteraceae bacterium]